MAPISPLLSAFKTQNNPVRTELVEVPVHPEPVEGTELVEVPARAVEVPLHMWQGFDRLSPNGVAFVFSLFVFPIILSLSKDRLSPNGCGGVANIENTNHSFTQSREAFFRSCSFK
jgi:hypothetical protein